ncbi:PIN domain-containing protein [Hylemonella sp. W303a]|uniref:type II toxin-antitoxin system VapC family toxin n=1 Tax=Hylemonella sp. W303a TaxID=3389873 RepID=UPI00396AFEE5
MTVLVDSSVWIDHLRGDLTPAVHGLRGMLFDQSREVITADLITLEVVRGCRTERDAARVQAMLLRFPCASLGGIDAALRAAALYRKLRAKGVTLAKTVDLLIASWCIHEGVALLHDDADFDAAEGWGLRVWRA